MLIISVEFDFSCSMNDDDRISPLKFRRLSKRKKNNQKLNLRHVFSLTPLYIHSLLNPRISVFLIYCLFLTHEGGELTETLARQVNYWIVFCSSTFSLSKFCSGWLCFSSFRNEEIRINEECLPYRKLISTSGLTGLVLWRFDANISMFQWLCLRYSMSVRMRWLKRRSVPSVVLFFRLIRSISFYILLILYLRLRLVG